jgi:AcrR family transcriptional regulator
MSQILNRRKEVGDALVREAVMDAAIKVLRDKGLSGLTMDAVSEAAGVAKGTLYNYFKNKDELLEAVDERLFRPLKEALDELLSNKQSAVLEIIETMVHAVLDFVERDRSILFLLHECPSLDQTRARHELEFVEDVAALIQRGIDQGELREQDPKASAWFMLGLISFSCRGPIERPGTCPPVERLPALLSAFLAQGLSHPDPNLNS